jgi:mRNA turnover protein 4
MATKASFLPIKLKKKFRSKFFIFRYFNNAKTESYGRPGTVACQTIVLEKGCDAFMKMSHSIEPYLRKLGLDTQLVVGEI